MWRRECPLLPAIDEQEGQSFDILDRTSERARVMLAGAHVVVGGRNFRAQGAVSTAGDALSAEAVERLGRFLSGRGHEWWPGDPL
jgi:hypothetical protein